MGIHLRFVASLIALCAVLASAVVQAQGPQSIRMAVVKATVLAPSLLVQKHLPPGWKT